MSRDIIGEKALEQAKNEGKQEALYGKKKTSTTKVVVTIGAVGILGFIGYKIFKGKFKKKVTTVDNKVIDENTATNVHVNKKALDKINKLVGDSNENTNK